MTFPHVSINKGLFYMVVTERFCWVTSMKSTCLFIFMSKIISAYYRFNIWETVLVIKIQVKFLAICLCPSGHKSAPGDMTLGT